MKTITACKPGFDNDYLDSILEKDCDTAISDLELIDLLIERAKETGVDLRIKRDLGNTLSLDQAYTLRFELGQDIRR
jgi:hypothetical protein